MREAKRGVPLMFMPRAHIEPPCMGDPDTVTERKGCECQPIDHVGVPATISIEVSTCGCGATVTLIEAENDLPPTARLTLTVSVPAATATALALNPSAATFNVSVVGVVFVHDGVVSGVCGAVIGWPF